MPYSMTVRSPVGETNTYSQIGDGTTTDRHTPTQTATLGIGQDRYRHFSWNTPLMRDSR